jgi:hypothetical protein
MDQCGPFFYPSNTPGLINETVIEIDCRTHGMVLDARSGHHMMPQDVHITNPAFA